MRILFILLIVVLLKAQVGWDLGTSAHRYYAEEILIYWADSAAKVYKSERLHKVFLTGSKITLQGTGVFTIEDIKGTQIRIILRDDQIYEIP